jgi:NAD(P)H-dependent FMN reductase
MTSFGIELLALNGSPSASSKTHVVAARVVELAGGGKVVDLADEGLLGRQPSPDVAEVIDQIRTTLTLLVTTPIHSNPRW